MTVVVAELVAHETGQNVRKEAAGVANGFEDVECA